jgi:hypothetical protein
MFLQNARLSPNCTASQPEDRTLHFTVLLIRPEIYPDLNAAAEIASKESLPAALHALVGLGLQSFSLVFVDK